MLVPVRVLDHHADPGIHPFRRPDDQVAGGFVHQTEAEIGPALLPLRPDAALALAVGEKEVVEDDFVEQAGRELDHLPDLVPVLGVTVAVGLEAVALVDRQGDAARDLEPPFPEKFRGVFHRLRIRDDRVPVRFQVNLVDLHLARDRVPVGLQPFGIGHPPHLVDAGVDGNGEIAVVPRGREGVRE